MTRPQPNFPPDPAGILFRKDDPMVTSDLGACEWFVWDLRRSGLIDRGQLDSIVSEFLKRNPRS